MERHRVRWGLSDPRLDSQLGPFVFPAVLPAIRLAALLPLASACIDRSFYSPDPGLSVIPCPPAPGPAQRGADGVDLLFVVDSSGSMADEQALLKAQLSALMQTLRDMPGGLSDLHIGVTSTDLGVGMYEISFCDRIPHTESLCTDGRDNDEDCLTDTEDPDCQ
jgi:hypothetical protein